MNTLLWIFTITVDVDIHEAKKRKLMSTDTGEKQQPSYFVQSQ